MIIWFCEYITHTPKRCWSDINAKLPHGSDYLLCIHIRVIVQSYAKTGINKLIKLAIACTRFLALLYFDFVFFIKIPFYYVERWICFTPWWFCCCCYISLVQSTKKTTNLYYVHWAPVALFHIIIYFACSFFCLAIVWFYSQHACMSSTSECVCERERDSAVGKKQNRITNNVCCNPFSPANFMLQQPMERIMMHMLFVCQNFGYTLNLVVADAGTCNLSLSYFSLLWMMHSRACSNRAGLLLYEYANFWFSFNVFCFIWFRGNDE